MNINYAQGIVVLTVLACVLPANCVKAVEKSSSKSGIENASSKSNHKNDENSTDDKKKTMVESMLLNIATVIQKCVDNKTMNNKPFKKSLDKLYKNLVRSQIKKSLKTYSKQVSEIKKKYDDDVGALKIMNSMSDGENNKNKDNPSKKSGKK